jgi:RimJ/RimL family protein N-acetyltransferase
MARGAIMNMVICETSRLILRPSTIEDAGAVALMNADPEVYRFIGGFQTPEQTRERIQKSIDHQRLHGFARWSVVLKSTGELIGRCGPMLTQIEGITEVELGYAYARVCWGCGFATEAADAALEYCFRTLEHRRVVAIIDPENHASIRVAMKIGMAYERPIQWKGIPVNLYAVHFS